MFPKDPIPSRSLCFPREIFPYLVVVIGLENVLVLTKSVVSTPVDLEVKLRIAQGKTPVGCGRPPFSAPFMHLSTVGVQV